VKFRKGAVLVAWASVVISWFLVQRRSGFGPVDALQRLVDNVSGRWWAVLAFLVPSIVRPLVLFPATLLTVAAGLLFGPVLGVMVAVTGANAAAMVGWALLKVKWRPFLFATALGSFPGTVAFVLAGASITRLDQGSKGINGWTFNMGSTLRTHTFATRSSLAMSVALILGSIGVSQTVKRKQQAH
jgi:uncharacterized membrane protein YdjX (TVP38/TMEM64 family)